MADKETGGLEKISFNENVVPGYKTVLFETGGKYSPMLLNGYDRERHIPVEDSYKLIENQNDQYLDEGKLEKAIENGEIKVYEFKGEEFLDRLDVGRVFHETSKEKEGVIVDRYFSSGYEDPLNSSEYDVRHLKIQDFKTGETIFEIENAEMPTWMDDVSAQIVAQKYFFKPDKKEWKEKIKNTIGSDHEYSLKHLNKRVADFFTDEGWKFEYFKSEEDRENFRNELYFLQAKGIGAFNSPTQFNAGLFNSYGIEGSPGINYWKDPETGEVKKVTNGEYIHPQLHACFIKGPNDNLESIAQNVVDEIAIFSSGSGIGHDIGKLRGNGEKLSGGGQASGTMSFFEIYDKVAGAIKSGGKTRRAARMTTMRYNHRDVIEFVRSKVKEDRKAKTLMENGFSGGMDGEAYTTVALQNTNLSVRADDEFFKAVEEGREIGLRNVNDGKIVKKVSSERMLKEIAFGSWRIGDPAIQYESKIQEMHTAKNSGRQNSTNPCSEYLFLDDTSCSLYSLRLTHFLEEDGSFNVEDFKKANRVFSIAQNIANKSASYPVKEIAQISTEFETIGAGYADLGSLLMRKGIPYNSEKGRAITGAITSVLTGSAYETSSEIAKANGSFTHFEFNKKPMVEVMKKHKKNLDDILWEEIDDENLKKAAYDSWGNVIEQGERHGFSNAQATVLAPTGTISYLMGCSTTGIEPAMSLRITKNLAGGGNVIIANKDVEIALNNLGYNESEIADISKYVGKRNTLRNAPHVKPEHYPIFDTAFGNVEGEGSISFEGHLRMVGAAQPFISGAISKTNNLPESATVKDIYDGYLLGRDLGLKAISVFRNNSKPISAVSFGDKDNKKFGRGEKEDLPNSRDSHEWEVEIGGTPLHIITSEYEDGRPGQITFLSYKSGSTVGSLLTTSGISASKSLKRGIHLDDVVAGWEGQQFEPLGLVRGHKYIKTANSPLDFAQKLLRLEYRGDTDVANEPEKVNINDLRGFQNGAFRTYERMNFDDWDIEQVLNDSETGGFVKNSNGKNIVNGKRNNKKGNNSNGKSCSTCGNLMVQTAPNCFECPNCGDKIGGCGA
ncbi:MAG: vitamin B12-dependent ribonucleotide reductase [Candidatus Pacearchaeota archaeon]